MGKILLYSFWVCFLIGKVEIFLTEYDYVEYYNVCVCMCIKLGKHFLGFLNLREFYDKFRILILL